MPQLVEKPKTPPILEPRAYEPLITTPSPTISRATTPSSFASSEREPRPSVLLPPTPIVQLPKKQLLTVSLEKAKEAMNAPGAVRLLPEELRAQNPLSIARSKSQDPIRKSSLDIFQSNVGFDAPVAATLVDTQGRDRLIQSPIGTSFPATPMTSYSVPPWTPTEVEASYNPTIPTQKYTAYSPTDRKTSDSSFKVGSGPAKTMAPLAAQLRPESRTKAAQSLGLADADEPRGRTMHRGPRKLSYGHYIAKSSSKISDRSNLSMEGETDAEAIAMEYHSLLTKQYRQASASPANDSTTSDEAMREHMTMAPPPLFKAKPVPAPARQRPNGTSDRRGHTRADSDSAVSQRSGSSNGTMFPGPYDEPGHRRRSTSGSIPISLPSLSIPSEPALLEESTRADPGVQPRMGRSRRMSVEERTTSLYYPHIMPRKNNKKTIRAKVDGSPAPPMPLLTADIIAQRRGFTDDRPDLSPIPSAAGSDAASTYSNPSTSKPLHQRMFKGAAKYADKLTRPSMSREPNGRDRSISPSSLASPASPHLLPSPSSGKASSNVHLGWSHQSKASFDNSRASFQSHRNAGQPQIEHLITPARPLDETRMGLKDPEVPSRKGSIFGGMMDGWRENKQTKRREELKKMITVVPLASDASDGTPSRRPSIMERRLSSFGWT